MTVPFHILLSSLRRRAGFGLREFAQLIGESAGNYSNVESGRRPWRSESKLLRVAAALKLREGSEDWDLLFVAASGYTALPPDLESELEKPLTPSLIRAVKEQRLTYRETKELIAHIEKAYPLRRRA